MLFLKMTTTLIAGTAMGVIVGAVMIIAPWTVDVGSLLAKLLVTLLGFVFVVGAFWFSKG